MNDDITTIVAAATEPGSRIFVIVIQVDMIAKCMAGFFDISKKLRVASCGGIFCAKNYLQKSQRVTRAQSGIPLRKL